MSLLSLHPVEKFQIIYYVCGGFIRVHNDLLRKGVSLGEFNSFPPASDKVSLTNSNFLTDTICFVFRLKTLKFTDKDQAKLY